MKRRFRGRSAPPAPAGEGEGRGGMLSPGRHLFSWEIAFRGYRQNEGFHFVQSVENSGGAREDVDECVKTYYTNITRHKAVKLL